MFKGSWNLSSRPVFKTCLHKSCLIILCWWCRKWNCIHVAESVTGCLCFCMFLMSSFQTGETFTKWAEFYIVQCWTHNKRMPNCAKYQHISDCSHQDYQLWSLTAVNRIIKYDLWLQWVHIDPSRAPTTWELIGVSMLSSSFIRVFSSLMFCLFWDNVLHKNAAP